MGQKDPSKVENTAQQFEKRLALMLSRYISRPSNSMFGRIAYNNAEYGRMGLLTDDLIQEDSFVKEAVSRMPLDVQDKRTFRITRALLLSNQKFFCQKKNGFQWRRTK